jgi:outer membrane protein assembly factor BamB
MFRKKNSARVGRRPHRDNAGSDKPLAQADRIWLASATGTVVAFDRQSGEQRQTVTCPQSLSGQLLLVEGAVWAAAVDGTLYRVSPAVEGSVP